jgi:hypothetical protein
VVLHVTHLNAVRSVSRLQHRTEDKERTTIVWGSCRSSSSQQDAINPAEKLCETGHSIGFIVELYKGSDSHYKVSSALPSAIARERFRPICTSGRQSMLPRPSSWILTFTFTCGRLCSESFTTIAWIETIVSRLSMPRIRTPSGCHGSGLVFIGHIISGPLGRDCPKRNAGAVPDCPV